MIPKYGSEEKSDQSIRKYLYEIPFWKNIENTEKCDSYKLLN